MSQEPVYSPPHNLLAHPVVIVIDDVGIALSCHNQDDLFLYY